MLTSNISIPFLGSGFSFIFLLGRVHIHITIPKGVHQRSIIESLEYLKWNVVLLTGTTNEHLIGGRQKNPYLVEGYKRNHCRPGALTLFLIVKLQPQVLFSLCASVFLDSGVGLYIPSRVCSLVCHWAESNPMSLLGLGPGSDAHWATPRSPGAESSQRRKPVVQQQVDP